MSIRPGAQGLCVTYLGSSPVSGTRAFLGVLSTLLDSSSGSLANGAWEPVCSQHTAGCWNTHLSSEAPFLYRQQTWNVNWAPQEDMVPIPTVLGATYAGIPYPTSSSKECPPEKQHVTLLSAPPGPYCVRACANPRAAALLCSGPSGGCWHWSSVSLTHCPVRSGCHLLVSAPLDVLFAISGLRMTRRCCLRLFCVLLSATSTFCSHKSHLCPGAHTHCPTLGLGSPTFCPVDDSVSLAVKCGP